MKVYENFYPKTAATEDTEKKVSQLRKINEEQ